jgi:hypothetical protein
MSRNLRILKPNLVHRLPAAWRVGADHPQAQPGGVRNRDTPSVQERLNVLANSSGTDTWTQNWTLDPVTVPDQLRRLRPLLH